MSFKDSFCGGAVISRKRRFRLFSVTCLMKDYALIRQHMLLDFYCCCFDIRRDEETVLFYKSKYVNTEKKALYKNIFNSQMSSDVTHLIKKKKSALVFIVVIAKTAPRIMSLPILSQSFCKLVRRTSLTWSPQPETPTPSVHLCPHIFAHR